MPGDRTNHHFSTAEAHWREPKRNCPTAAAMVKFNPRLVDQLMLTVSKSIKFNPFHPFSTNFLSHSLQCELGMNTLGSMSHWHNKLRSARRRNCHHNCAVCAGGEIGPSLYSGGCL